MVSFICLEHMKDSVEQHQPAGYNISKKTLKMCGLVDDPDCRIKGKDQELKKAEVEKSEKAVVSVMAAIRNFTNPFEVADKIKLYNLASGAPVLHHDVMQAKIKVKNQKDDFIRVRLASGRSADLFFEPIPQLKLR